MEDKIMDRLIDFFKEMEKRYHTWMNFYSLFNGALLVAFCTILISTGKIVELEGVANDVADSMNGGAKVFYLNCTYWDMLTLISSLGVLASYCWYLSMIGHRNWTASWRGLMKEHDTENILSSLRGNNLQFEQGIHGKVLPGFHSTYEITQYFIRGVLYAWIYAAGYSWRSHAFSWRLLCFSGIIFILLLALETKIHLVIGSNVTGFTLGKCESGKGKSEKGNSVVDYLVLIIIVVVIIVLCYCFYQHQQPISFSSQLMLYKE